MTLADLVDGQMGELTVLCTSCKETYTRASNKEKTDFKFSDKSGTADGVMWKHTNVSRFLCNTPSIVDIIYEVVIYNGAIQITVKDIQLNTTKDKTEFYPCSEIPLERLYSSLVVIVDEIEDETLNKITKKLLFDSKVSSLVKEHSAAVTVHHAFVGGWLEHTLSIALLANSICSIYTWINKGLLLSAALLHDIGKLQEIRPYPNNDYSDKGNLLGHIPLGLELILTTAIELGLRDDSIVDDLLHCVISHHGKLEYGSPKVPALPEALVLSSLDMLDSKLEILKEALSGLKDNQWSSYNKYLETCLRK